MTNNQQSTRYFSSKQEKSIAKALKGRLQPNSGATPFKKGDVVNDRFLFEAKTSMTEKDSYSVKKVQLDKLEIERSQMRKEFCALVFNYGPEMPNYYILSEKQLKSLLQEIKDLKN